MSWRPRAVRTYAHYFLLALLLPAAFLTLSWGGSAQAGKPSAPGITFASTRSLYNSFASRLLDPPTWQANVRANTDNTGFGQHEPSLAVSPVNPNVVVIANKD